MLGVTMAYTAMHRNNNPRPATAGQPPTLPYRDHDNITIRYATTSPSAVQPHNPYSNYDSDMEPLVTSAATSNETELDEEALNRFTATGRPIPSFKASGMANNPYFLSAPQFLPRRYTDESIIPAIVVNVIPSPPPAQEGEGAGIKEKPRRPSFLNKLKSEKPKNQPTTLTKVIFMPRGEYLKYFARNQAGEYTGTEPYKQWTEQELEETFGKYKPVEKKGKKGWASYVF